MAANQINFSFFTYVDDNAATWNKRGELDAAQNALDGSTVFTAGVRVWGRESRRFHTRKAVFTDSTTFRKKRVIVYTAAAFAALTGASTLAVNVPGNVAAVTYTLSEKIPERQPIAAAANHLADHT